MMVMPQSPDRSRYRTPLPFATEVLQDEMRRQRSPQKSYKQPTLPSWSRQHSVDEPYVLIARGSYETTRSNDFYNSKDAIIHADSWLPYRRPERSELQKFATELENSDTQSSSSSGTRTTALTVTPLTDSSNQSPPLYSPGKRSRKSSTSQHNTPSPTAIVEGSKLSREIERDQFRERSLSASRWNSPDQPTVRPNDSTFQAVLAGGDRLGKQRSASNPQTMDDSHSRLAARNLSPSPLIEMSPPNYSLPRSPIPNDLPQQVGTRINQAITPKAEPRPYASRVQPRTLRERPSLQSLSRTSSRMGWDEDLKAVRRRSTSAWRPPSVWYEQVDGVSLSTRPKSPKETQTGLSIPEIEARDIRKIERGRKGRVADDYLSEFSGRDSHFADYPPPVGRSEGYVRNLSPKPVIQGRDHVFFDNYSRAADDEMPEQRADPPRPRRTEHSNPDAVHAPEPIIEISEPDSDYSSDEEAALPPHVARVREQELRDMEMTSRTDHVKSLLSGMMKNLSHKSKRDRSKNTDQAASGRVQQVQANAEDASSQRLMVPAENNHRYSSHSEATTAFMWEDDNEGQGGNKDAVNPAVWSSPQANKRSSHDSRRADLVPYA